MPRPSANIARYRTLRGAQAYAEWLKKNAPNVQSAVPEIVGGHKYAVRVYLTDGATGFAAPRPRKRRGAAL